MDCGSKLVETEMLEVLIAIHHRTQEEGSMDMETLMEILTDKDIVVMVPIQIQQVAIHPLGVLIPNLLGDLVSGQDLALGECLGIFLVDQGLMEGGLMFNQSIEQGGPVEGHLLHLIKRHHHELLQHTQPRVEDKLVHL
jgi:hypothetical protein